MNDVDAMIDMLKVNNVRPELFKSIRADLIAELKSNK